MKNFSNALLSELEAELKRVHDNYENPMQYAEHAIKLTIKKMEQLKTFFNSYTFENKTEEIEFFKIIKPEFASKLIYYNEIYNIEIAKPSSSKKELKKYYRCHVAKLKHFHKENTAFIKYYRTGSTCLDKKYFLRGKHDIKLTLDSFYLQSDYNFATSHDYKVAQIITNNNIQNYIETKIKALKSKIPNSDLHNDKPLKWTSSKVALVELVYALHSGDIFNNGNASLKEIATSIGTFFNMELGQFNRIYIEIRNRKTIEKTDFLNTLKENLITRMEKSDEK